MTEAERRICAANGTLEAEYGAAVNRKIRARYALSEELSILRQRDEKPEDFAAYNAFCEACKAEARAELIGEEVSV